MATVKMKSHFCEDKCVHNHVLKLFRVYFLLNVHSFIFTPEILIASLILWLGETERWVHRRKKAKKN